MDFVKKNIYKFRKPQFYQLAFDSSDQRIYQSKPDIESYIKEKIEIDMGNCCYGACKSEAVV